MADRSSARALPVSLLLIAGTVAAGLALRLLPLSLPPPVTKHGGSLLWAAMIYWIVTALRPRWSPVSAALAAGAIAAGVECSQLLHWPPMDAFRLTPLGALLLGRVFAVTDLVAYAAAIIVTWQIDKRIRSQRAEEGT